MSHPWVPACLISRHLNRPRPHNRATALGTEMEMVDVAINRRPSARELLDELGNLLGGRGCSR
jgi:hypothetical protein